SDVTMNANGPFGNGSLNLSGTGFSEGTTTVLFGNQSVVDVGNSPGLDVNSGGTRINMIVPNDLPSGPIRVTTVGGTSAAFGTALTGVTATATTGTAGNTAQASAIPGQTITLTGSGFDTSIDILFDTVDVNGQRSQVIVRPATVATGGASATV